MRSFTVAVAAASVAAGLTIHATNTTASGNHANFFLDDSIDGQGMYAASVIEACNPLETVYAIQCTGVADDDYYVDSRTCGSDAPTLTVTAGPSTYFAEYSIATRVAGEDGVGTVAESCKVIGTTKADCTVSLSVSIAGTSTTIVDSAIYTGTDFHVHQVSITGGAEKTKKVNPTGVCEARQNGPGPNAGTAMSPNVVRVWGAVLVVGLLGVAAL
ncbi:uncharacterized protein C8A04DRAFT_14080 [Dichotomopilus funicola]|uniref:Uncharacterized protein n=1 Tax=Dichotomopilus funicola TaxID=1934379 RepID=A0AAN6UYK8_9PEZI|nr:hypothetical protein C8A04DRAFT_14080 [Dichotomopilus funicola]